MDVVDHGIGTYSRKTIEPLKIVGNIGGSGSGLYSAAELEVLESEGGESMSAALYKCTNPLCSSSDKRGASSVNVAMPSFCKMLLMACRDGLFKL